MSLFGAAVVGGGDGRFARLEGAGLPLAASGLIALYTGPDLGTIGNRLLIGAFRLAFSILVLGQFAVICLTDLQTVQVEGAEEQRDIV